MPRKAEDLTGRVFGTRRVLGRAPDRRYGGNPTIYWHVRCRACGTESDVQGASLRRGHGCAVCYRGTGHPPRPARDDGLPLTVGRLLTLLRQMPQRARVMLTLVAKDGYAITPARRELRKAQGAVLLTAKMPTRLTRYDS